MLKARLAFPLSCSKIRAKRLVPPCCFTGFGSSAPGLSLGRIVGLLCLATLMFSCRSGRSSRAWELSHTDPRRYELAGDPHRPGYHFLPPADWMDDANGVMEIDGIYHLFYQYTPGGAGRNTAPFHWGHAVSEDLLHWRDLDIALSPTDGGLDEQGCWSGSAGMNAGVPTLIYRARPAGAVIATSDDGLITWNKKKTDMKGGDPHVWRENDTWYCVMGAGSESTGGLAHLFKSDDLLKWERVTTLVSGKTEETGPFWELAQLFEVGDKRVLTFCSHKDYTGYYISGSYRNHEFKPEVVDRLNYGGHFYAPYSFTDSRGRRILIGWSWEGRTERAYKNAGWAGVHTVPRVLSIRDDGRLGYEPIEELETLRDQHSHFESQPINPRPEPRLLPDVQGDMLELIAEIDPGSADSVGLVVFASPDRREETRIVFDRKTATLSIDRSRASLDPTVHKTRYIAFAADPVYGGSLDLAEGEPLRLRVYVDRSIVEVFANGRLCLTDRVYPTLRESTGIGVFATGGGGALKALDVWTLRPVWPIKR